MNTAAAELADRRNMRAGCRAYTDLWEIARNWLRPWSTRTRLRPARDCDRSEPPVGHAAGSSSSPSMSVGSPIASRPSLVNTSTPMLRRQRVESGQLMRR